MCSRAVCQGIFVQLQSNSCVRLPCTPLKSPHAQDLASGRHLRKLFFPPNYTIPELRSRLQLSRICGRSFLYNPLSYLTGNTPGRDR